MLKALIQTFRGNGKERTNELQDPVLRTLRFAEKAWWEADVAVQNRNLRFKIGGDSEPDEVLILHARDIVRSIDDFDKMIAEFLADAAVRMPGCADEIRQLVIEDVMLCWPKRPNDGMIYFKGPNNYRLWRCDYAGRKPQGLGFDG